MAKKNKHIEKPVIIQKTLSLFSHPLTKAITVGLLIIFVMTIALYIKCILHNSTRAKVSELLSRAETAHSQKYYSEALELYELAIDYAPQNNEPYIHIADIYTLKNDFASTEEILLKGSDIVQNKEPIFLKLGEVSIQAKDYTTALTYLSQADTSKQQTMLYLIQVYVYLGNTENAQGYINNVINAYGKNNYTAYYQALITLMSDPQAARIHLEDSNIPIEDDSLVIESIARVKNNIEKILSAQEQTYQTTLIGYTLLTEKCYQLALIPLQNVINANPDYRDGQALMGSAYFNLGDYDKAREHIQSAIHIDPNYAHAYYLLATLQAQNNNLLDARTYYKTLLDLAPHTLKYYDSYIDFLKKQEDYIEMETVLQNITADEQFSDEEKNVYTVQLAYLYLDHLGKLQEGLVLAQPFEQSEIYAWALHKNEQSGEALIILNKRISETPTASLYYHLGYVQKTLGLSNDAEQSFNRALELDTEGHISQMIEEEKH